MIAGATGLVGSSLLEQLLADDGYDAVVALSRKDLPLSHVKLKTVIVDFDHLKELAGTVSGHHYFCCLGTTIKKAGSREAFFKVDFTYCHSLARLAKQDTSSEQFHIVTAQGANAGSVIYYNKVKGQLEDSLKSMELPSLHIYQPTLLLGKRSEPRLMEDVAKFFSKALSFLVIGGSGRKFFGIEASQVAKGMLSTAKTNMTGNHTYPSRVIENM